MRTSFAAYATAALAALGLAGQASAKFAAPAGCTDATESEFKYVKIVTMDSDPSMSEPLKMAFDMQANGNVDVYWIERHGKLKMLDGTKNTVSVVGTVPVFDGGENGLTGIAMDPGYKQNHWIYLYYAAVAPEFHLSRFTITNGQLVAGSEKILIKIPEERTVPHTAGAMEFDSYGDLWIAIGKNCSDYPSVISETVRKNSCESSSSNAGDMRGGLLRIHPDDKAPKGYTIPVGNFAEYFANYFNDQGKTALAQEYTAKVPPEIYVKGTRNAYSITVDPVRRWIAWGEFGVNEPWITEEHNLTTHPMFGGFPYFAGNQVDLTGDPRVDPAAGTKIPATPMNNSKWNTGPKQLPPATPGIHSYLRAGAVTGPIYRYDGDLQSKVKWPPEFDKAWLTTDWHWPRAGVGIRIYQVSDDGTQLIDSLGWFGTIAMDHPLDMKVGPDGAVYVVNYGPAFFSTSPTTHLARIEYTGTCAPPLPKFPTVSNVIGMDVSQRSLGRIDADLRRVRVRETGNYNVKIRDFQGREIFSVHGSGPQEFPLGKTLQGNKGVYFVTLELPGKSFTSKLLNF